MLPWRPGWTDNLLNFFLNGLQKLEFGRAKDLSAPRHNKVCCDVTMSCVHVARAVACVLVWLDSNLRPTRRAAALVTTTSQCLVVTRVGFILVF